ncbi:phytanoyl-CoA dioxygenase family protein [Candidatus Albibeggiatoa sp. nov. NOAA]|uniref:phytanoyl-CoA dioxygenase family protein n=1 Tax=Candidatus Albibeggiatoa sp. nov. NOAA TaxID=3162724 RepID=UPI0033040F04|nr:phytanoyl-CoA dioxygenase family protein [Thiotrichaceae bacterium]
MMSSYTTQIQHHGFALCPAVLDAETITQLSKKLHIEGALHGIRDVFNKYPIVRQLAESKPILQLVRSILGDSAFPVKALYFNKTLGHNWNVAWHQDLNITVKQQIYMNGFHKWSIKQGIYHVQPPVSLLENMLTLRIHLDDASKDNGALRVISGSHKHGKIGKQDLSQKIKQDDVVICEAQAGDVLLMRPLLLHASHKNLSLNQRRVIHIEFAAQALPEPLQWYETIK